MQVTTDPRSQNDPKNENPGVVTSDSLAAQSIREGGSFAANSDARGPMDQPSYSTNTNTTDTSNAVRLEPAVDAEARQASEEWNESAQLNATLSGKGPTYNTASGGSDSGVTSAAGNVEPKPKGQNLQEGGFDPNAPNASFNTDIGSKNDPGRAALDRIDVPVAGGAGPRQSNLTNDGQFDVLKDASA
jgi:hypothetical protein